MKTEFTYEVHGRAPRCRWRCYGAFAAVEGAVRRCLELRKHWGGHWKLVEVRRREMTCPRRVPRAEGESV